MNTLSFAEARSGLKKVMDGVCKNHEPTAVALADGGHVVMLSLQDYSSMQETMHLLGSAKNAARLMESIDQLRTGKVKPRDLKTATIDAAISVERKDKGRRSAPGCR